MRVTATERVSAVIERVRRTRTGALTITIGTGCCESTAPFLYEDYWPGPDQEQVGEIAGVPVFAPDHLRANYPGDDGVVIDVLEGNLAESLSIETELDCRFILRGLDAVASNGIDAAFGVDLGVDAVADPANSRSAECRVAVLADTVESCVPTVATGGPSLVVGELPEALRRMRLR
jgi:uncharacterized protein (DUF779 family)